MKPTPLEIHEGIHVKREDKHPSGFPSGKLRGLLPYLEQLKKEGVRLIVNAGASHSNSHAIVSFAAKRVGMDAVTFTNTPNMKPALLAAAEAGDIKIVLGKPMHLGPLKAKAAQYTKTEGGVMLPWGLTDFDIIKHYARAVEELDPMPGVYHVVPFGAGGWAAGVWLGLIWGRRLNDIVVAVPVMPTDSDNKKLRKILSQVRAPGFGEGQLIYDRLPENVKMMQAIESPTPWPSDPKYEHMAWGVAKYLHHVQEKQVVFWSIGQAVGEDKK